MPDDYLKFIEKDIEDFITHHKKVFSFEPEMVKFLKQIIIKNNIPLDKEYFIGDICCGLGEISYHLKDLFPNSKFLGIDISKEQIKLAKQLFKDFGLQNRYSFEVGDIYNLKDYRFDIVINWMTLMALDDYKKSLKNLVKVTKMGGHIFISSLFNDPDVDIYAKLYDRTRLSGKAGIPANYNTYSLRNFREYAYSLGVSKVDCYDFEIDIDLPKTMKGLGTYTLKLKNGKQIQISAGYLMNWKIIHITK